MTQSWQQVAPATWRPVGTVRGPMGLSVEAVPFTMSGPLRVVTSVGAYPLPGPCRIVSIEAMVEDTPTGSPVVVDVLASGQSVFANPNDRPTIAAASRRAVVGPIVDAVYGEEDFLNVDVVQVGSLTPGAFLTVVIRLALGGDTTP